MFCFFFLSVWMDLLPCALWNFVIQLFKENISFMISLHLPLVLQCSVNIICNLVCNSLKENILSCIVNLFHILSFVYFLEEWCGGQPGCEW